MIAKSIRYHSLALVTLLCLSAANCETFSPTQPLVSGPGIPRLEPGLPSHFTASGTSLFSQPFPSGTPTLDVAFVIPDSQTVYYRLEGKILVTHSQQFNEWCAVTRVQAPFLLDPRCDSDFRVGAWGGLGIPFDDPRSLVVTTYGTNSSGTTNLPVMSAIHGDSGVVGGITSVLQSIDSIRRVGVTAPTATDGTTLVPVYNVNGTQQFIIEALGPATAVPQKTVLATAEMGTWTADGNGGSIADPTWTYVPDDTLPTPLGSGGSYNRTVCLGQATCSFTPSWSGRVYITFATINGVRWSGKAPASAIVWVGKKKLSMSCAPDSTVVGGSVSCSAGTSPAGGTISDVEWSYSGQVEHSSQSGTTWTGNIKSGGVVTVAGVLDGVQQTACDTIHCRAFNDSTATDSILSNPDLQEELLTLWKDSDPGSTAPIEQGAFIAENPSTGERRLVRWVHNGRCKTDPADTPWPNPDEVIVGWVHTHPNEAGDPVPIDDPTCQPGDIFIDLPSADDLNFSANHLIKGTPGYVLTADRIHRFGTDLSSSFTPKSFPWSSICE